VRYDLKRRLRAVEIARSGGIEIWVKQDDGMARSLDGKQIATCEEAEARARATGMTLIFFFETATLLLRRSQVALLERRARMDRLFN
jgi:hypothetical protein